MLRGWRNLAAFVTKEHVGEGGVRYGTGVSQNRRVFVDGFAMNRLTIRRGHIAVHLRNAVRLFPLSHLPYAYVPLAEPYFLFFRSTGPCAAREFK